MIERVSCMKWTKIYVVVCDPFLSLALRHVMSTWTTPCKRRAFFVTSLPVLDGRRQPPPLSRSRDLWSNRDPPCLARAALLRLPRASTSFRRQRQFRGGETVSTPLRLIAPRTQRVMTLPSCCHRRSRKKQRTSAPGDRSERQVLRTLLRGLHSGNSRYQRCPDPDAVRAEQRRASACFRLFTALGPMGASEVGNHNATPDRKTRLRTADMSSYVRLHQVNSRWTMSM
ncbi:hypothetical protein V8E55_008869, partial [Tylopilus felleus]